MKTPPKAETVETDTVRLAFPLIMFALLSIWTLALTSGLVSFEFYQESRCIISHDPVEIYVRSDYDGEGILEYSATVPFHDSASRNYRHDQRTIAFDKAARWLPFVNARIGVRRVTLELQGYLYKVVEPAGFLPPDNAILAVPIHYEPGDVSWVRYRGVLLQRDLGPETHAIFASMTEFNPDSNWSPSE